MHCYTSESATSAVLRFDGRPVHRSAEAPDRWSEALDPRNRGDDREVVTDRRSPDTLNLHPEERTYLATRFSQLTERELDVLLELCHGGTNDEIASRLDVAIPTVRSHLMRLNRKLETRSKADAIRAVAGALIDGYRSRQLGRLAQP